MRYRNENNIYHLNKDKNGTSLATGYLYGMPMSSRAATNADMEREVSIMHMKLFWSKWWCQNTWRWSFKVLKNRPRAKVLKNRPRARMCVCNWPVCAYVYERDSYLLKSYKRAKKYQARTLLAISMNLVNWLLLNVGFASMKVPTLFSRVGIERLWIVSIPRVHGFHERLDLGASWVHEMYCIAFMLLCAYMSASCCNNLPTRGQLNNFFLFLVTSSVFLQHLWWVLREVLSPSSATCAWAPVNSHFATMYPSNHNSVMVPSCMFPSGSKLFCLYCFAKKYIMAYEYERCRVWVFVVCSQRASAVKRVLLAKLVLRAPRLSKKKSLQVGEILDTFHLRC